jgi:hypothetical protein
VNFTAQAQRPADGRVPLLAYAIGEESFTDANGNGVFDTNEAFVDSSEAFEDDAGTETTTVAATYMSNDFFFDFNNNGTRDGPDGNFNGVLCNDPAHCAAGASKSAGIGARNIIILSGSTPVLNELDANGNVIGSGLPAVTVTAPVSINVWVRDLHGNPMPGGTTVTGTVVSVAPSSYTLNGNGAYSVPCTAQAANDKTGATVFPFLISSTTPGNGQLNLTIKTPGGLTTLASIALH